MKGMNDDMGMDRGGKDQRKNWRSRMGAVVRRYCGRGAVVLAFGLYSLAIWQFGGSDSNGSSGSLIAGGALAQNVQPAPGVNPNTLCDPLILRNGTYITRCNLSIQQLQGNNSVTITLPPNASFPFAPYGASLTFPATNTNITYNQGSTGFPNIYDLCLNFSNFPCAGQAPVEFIGNLNQMLMSLEDYSSNGISYQGLSARGSNGSPLALHLNDTVGQFYFSGWDGNSFYNAGALFLCYASENWKPKTNAGEGCDIWTTPTGTESLTKALHIWPSGGISVGTKGDPGINNFAAANVVSAGTSASSNATVSSPTGTASTTGVMMGLAGAITPATSGNVMLSCWSEIKSPTAQTGVQGQITVYMGTGSAPTNGAALTGTAGAHNQVQFNGLAAATEIPLSTGYMFKGLTVGTAYWYDVALLSSNGADTVALTDLNCTAMEQY